MPPSMLDMLQCFKPTTIYHNYISCIPGTAVRPAVPFPGAAVCPAHVSPCSRVVPPLWLTPAPVPCAAVESSTSTPDSDPSSPPSASYLLTAGRGGTPIQEVRRTARVAGDRETASL